MIRRKKYTIEEVRDYIKTRGGKCLESEYKHNKHKMKFQCDKCLHIWSATFKSIKIKGNWCPKCSGRLNNNIDVARNLAKSRDGLCLSKIYRDNKTNMEWKCNKCDKTWWARLDRVKSGTWCPNCRRSHGERLISRILKQYKIRYKEEATFKSHGRCNRFDFLIEDYNLAIEFDGPQHFQIYRRYTPDQKTLDKIKLYDLQKTEYCLQNNIKLLRIAYNAVNVKECIQIAIETTSPLIVTDYDLYKDMLTQIDKNIPYKILLPTGTGQQ